YRRKLEQLRPGLIALASLVLVCGLLWNVRLMRVAGAVASQQELIRGNAVDIWSAAGVSGPSPETVGDTAVRFGELVNVMKVGIANADRKAKRSALDEWKKWADRVPKRLDIAFDEIRITQRQITIGGTTASAAEAERFQAVLNDGGQFRFELPKTEPAQDGRTRFTMRHEYEE
ncbi:unnamed protein product, partial [marine sediment metagenome]